MSVFFTIIVPVFNSEKTLKKTLDSVYKQSLKDIEVLIINDNSFDNSEKIIKNFNKKINNLKIIKNKRNLGVSISRNRGFKKSKGEYIIFLDSDDILLNGSLNYLRQEIKKQNRNFYFIKSLDLRKKTVDNNEIYFRKKKKTNFSSHIKSNFHFRPTCWNFICKRSFLVSKKLKFYNTRLYEDQIFTSQLINLTTDFDILRKPVYGRSIENPNSLGKTVGKDLGLSCLKCILELINFVETKNIRPNHVNFKFIISRINFLLQDFNLNIISSGMQDIKKYCDFIFLNKNLFNKIQNYKLKDKMFYFQNISYFTMKKKEILRLILKNKNYEIRKIIKKFKKHEISINYLFCANQISKIISKVCTIQKIKLDGIIDNNKFFEDKFIGKNKIVNINNIKKKIRKKNTNILICNLEKKLTQNLRKSFPIKKTLNLSSILS